MNALDHWKVASRPRAWCRSLCTGVSTVQGVVMYFTILSGYGFDPGWWLEYSRVVKVFESSCDIELRHLSFYGKIYEPQTRLLSSK